MATVPVNFRKSDNTSEAIVSAAEYAVSVADHYIGWFSTVPGLLGADRSRPLAGMRILEIGPGPTLGAAALLRCAGADVAVTDRFLPVWDADFHPAFFEELRRQVSARGAAYLRPIDRLLAAARFTPEIPCYSAGAERLDLIDDAFDMILSNAVVEHVEDLQATARNFAAKTTPNGYGFHQVDLRDHRDFSRPLEFLTLSHEEFVEMRREQCCECGGWWRSSDVESAFAQAGFSVHTMPNMFASPGYVADVRPRLQPAYASRPDADLSIISALYRVQRIAA